MRIQLKPVDSLLFQTQLVFLVYLIMIQYQIGIIFMQKPNQQLNFIFHLQCTYKQKPFDIKTSSMLPDKGLDRNTTIG